MDTNVPIVANGRPDHANGGRMTSGKCRRAAIDFLDKLLDNSRLLLDLAGEIQAEYREHLNPSGQPGVGDRFYQEVLRSAPERVERIDLRKLSDGSFADFPRDPKLASFDPSDRKFVALARCANAPVVVATDSDWVNDKAALSENGVKIEFLCGCKPNTWFET